MQFLKEKPVLEPLYTRQLVAQSERTFVLDCGKGPKTQTPLCTLLHAIWPIKRVCSSDSVLKFHNLLVKLCHTYSASKIQIC